jgi:hypothetical protein
LPDPLGPVVRIPVARIPFARIPVARIPFASRSFAGVPLPSLPIARVPAASYAVAAIAVAGITGIPAAGVATITVGWVTPGQIAFAGFPTAQFPVAGISIKAVESAARAGASVVRPRARGLVPYPRSRLTTAVTCGNGRSRAEQTEPAHDHDQRRGEDGQTAGDQARAEERHTIHVEVTTSVSGPIRRVSQTRLNQAFTIAA